MLQMKPLRGKGAGPKNNMSRSQVARNGSLSQWSRGFTFGERIAYHDELLDRLFDVGDPAVDDMVRRIGRGQSIGVVDP